MICNKDVLRANPSIKHSPADCGTRGFDMEAHARFDALENVGVSRSYLVDGCDVTESVDLHFEVGRGVPGHKVVEGVAGVLESLYDVRPEPELPHVDKVVFSGPVTVMIWPDGKKTKTRCLEGDDLDYVFGMLACILRKLTRNRGHAVRDNEAALKEMAAKINSMEDLDELLDYVALMHDTLAVLRESSALWVSQLGDPEDEGGDAPVPAGPSEEDLARQAELMRQIALVNEEIMRACKVPIDFGRRS